MAIPETIGERIKQAQRVAGVGNEELAEAAGVSLASVSNWRGDHKIPTDDNLVLIAGVLKTSVAWLRYGQANGNNPQGRRVSEPASGSQRIRIWLQEFRLELTKAGAEEDEISEAMQLLQSPEVYTYFSGGQRQEFGEDDVLKGMRAIAHVIRVTLRDRGRKIRLKPDDE